MKPEDVPDELLVRALSAYFDQWPISTDVADLATHDDGEEREGMIRALAAVLPEHERHIREQAAVKVELADDFPYEDGCSCREGAAAIIRAGQPRTTPLISYQATCSHAHGLHLFHSPAARHRWIDQHEDRWGEAFEGTTTDHEIEPGSQP